MKNVRCAFCVVCAHCVYLGTRCDEKTGFTRRACTLSGRSVGLGGKERLAYAPCSKNDRPAHQPPPLYPNLSYYTTIDLVAICRPTLQWLLRTAALRGG